MRLSTTALSLLLGSLLLAATLLHTTAQDSSSTADASSTGDFSSTGSGDLGNLSSSSTGTIGNSTSGNSTHFNTSSTGAAPAPIVPSRACLDANVYALAGGHDYVCGCVGADLATALNITNTTGLPSMSYHYSGQSWDGNWNYPSWEGEEADKFKKAPWKDSPSYYNYLDALTGSGDNNLTQRGYPQCYGLHASGNCFDQFDSSVLAASNKAGYAQGFYCEPTDKAPDFIKGDASPPICLVYGGGNRLHKMRFQPIVDQFALLTIQSSFNSTQGWAQLGHIGTAFQVELNGAKSEVRHRYGTQSSNECFAVKNADGTDKIDPDTDRPFPCTPGGTTCTVVPFHTIVIHLTQGVLQYIEFDDDDSLCSSSLSVDGNCAIPIDQCQGSTSYDKTNTATDTDCDFKVYVSWAGTDKDNTFLSSSGRRLSQFRRWSLNAVYNQASNFDTKDLPTVPSSDE